MRKQEWIAQDPESQKLYEQLRQLQKHLRNYTLQTYQRVNPFVEDVFDWVEKGAFLFGEEKGIKIFQSSTVVGDVQVGKNTWIGPFCSIDGTGGLKIGDNCSISAGCHIVSHDTVKWALSGGQAPYEYAPISIGDHCFIGLHVVITKGITIGNRCLIAAGAVVTHDIPDNSIAAGVPARIIGKVEVAQDGNVNYHYFK